MGVAKKCGRQETTSKTTTPKVTTPAPDAASEKVKK